MDDMERISFDELPMQVALLRQEIAELRAIVEAKLIAPDGYEPEQTFTIPQLAEYLNKSVSAVRGYKRNGKIPYYQTGKAIYFKKSEVDTALKINQHRKRFFK